MSMKIILRCDYFQGSGIGHLKRTSILSRALKKKGYKTTVLVDELPQENKINFKVDFQEMPFE